MDDEIAITAICDSNVFDNKLNDFKVKLAYPPELKQPYSLGLVDITYPNLLYNINRDDNFISLSFYKKRKSYKPQQITRIIDTENYILQVFLTYPIKHGYYANLSYLCEYLTSYSKVKYYYVGSKPTFSNIIQHQGDLENLNIINIANSINLDDLDKISHHISNFLGNWISSTRLLTRTIWQPDSDGVSLAQFKSDIIDYIIGGQDHRLFANWEILLNSIELRNLWFTVPELETIKLNTENTDIKIPSIKQKEVSELLVNIYNLSKRLFKSEILSNNNSFTALDILKYSIECYFKGEMYLDLLKDLPFDQPDYKFKQEGEDIGITRVNERTSRLDELDTPYDVSQYSTDYFDSEINSVKNRYTSLMSMLTPFSTMCIGKMYSDNDMKLKNMIFEGVQKRINLFLNDLKKILAFAKNKNLPNNRIDYLKTIKHDFIYIDPMVRTKATSFGTIEDLYISINHELEQFLKRFTQNDTDVTIDKLLRSNYNRGSSQKLQSEYTEVNFLGEELAPFFGHDGAILIHKNKKFVTSYQPAVKLRNTNMFLYCEQIREQHVNEILSPLLATIPIPPNSKFGDPVHHPVKKPHYLNLKK